MLTTLKKENRITTLDGLRGLAMIMVFLNHIDVDPITNAVPTTFQPLIQTLFLSGKTGVSMLFILGGFLMVYLYPSPANTTTFLQKRYSRIFPLYLTMVAVMTVFDLIPTLSILARFAVMFLFASITYSLWMLVKKINSELLNKFLFFAFVGVQILTGLWYLVGIMRHPAVYFTQMMNPALREATITLVNATLMLPLGDYIPMLDGVYWSLVSEVFFFILYPFFCVPIIQMLIRQKRWVKIAFLIMLMPFFVGVSIIAKNLFVLSMLQFPLFFYFATGITLGYLFRTRPEIVHTVHDKVKAITRIDMSIPLFILYIIAMHVFFADQQYIHQSWVRVLGAIPLTLFVALALTNKTHLSHLLNSKFLLFFGMISYSMYLCHTAIVDTAHLIMRPATVGENIIFIIGTFLCVIPVSYLLHLLLERPYFMKKQNSAPANHPHAHYYVGRVVIAIMVLYLGSIVLAFQSKVNFFSLEQKHGNDVLITPSLASQKQLISLYEYPNLTLTFKATENNLGLVMMNVQYAEDQTVEKPIHNEFQFFFREKGAKNWLVTGDYKSHEIGTNPDHLFGIPLLPDSKGKTYEMIFKLLYTKNANYTEIDISNSVLRTVYLLDKKTVLTDPSAAFALIKSRVVNIITDRNAQHAFMLFLPFAGIIIYAYGVHKKNDSFMVKK